MSLGNCLWHKTPKYNFCSFYSLSTNSLIPKNHGPQCCLHMTPSFLPFSCWEFYMDLVTSCPGPEPFPKWSPGFCLSCIQVVLYWASKGFLKGPIRSRHFKSSAPPTSKRVPLMPAESWSRFWSHLAPATITVCSPLAEWLWPGWSMPGKWVKALPLHWFCTWAWLLLLKVSRILKPGCDTE